jgi:SpoVK/Ycf46/Vps4 family AAA+-type ATPase
VARHYAKFLIKAGILHGSGFAEATGSSLANEGVNGTKKHIECLTKSGGGVFFVDEAYQLTSNNSFGGGAVLDFLLAEIEERIGSIVFIFAGYTREMETFFEHNPGLDSRLPHRMVFADYSNDELLSMLDSYVNQKYATRATLEGGARGIYAKILVDRLAASRGRPGFGNARSLHNAWSRVSERQAQRLVKERKNGLLPDDLFFSKDDLIGSQPKGILQASTAWRELQTMVGLEQVKGSINTLVGAVEKNYHRELAGKPPIQMSLNRIFVGNPGTGKTSVARLYAAILAELGLLSKNEGKFYEQSAVAVDCCDQNFLLTHGCLVVLKTPSDFVGAHLGESEKNTKAILRASEGKVLLIDEAYGLFAGGGVGTGQADIYKTAVIDTIVGEVQNTPGEDRCVLLLGYEAQMKEMLDHSNPGLARRFPISEAFYFNDFGDEDLRQILNSKLKKQGLGATDEAKDVVIGILSRARDRPHFGNAGEVENLINRAKAHHQARLQSSARDNEDPDVLFLPQDFDPDFDRASRSGSICCKIFSDLVGAQEWTGKFERLQRMVVNMKGRSQDPKEHIAFNWVFKGPPGKKSVNPYVPGWYCSQYGRNRKDHCSSESSRVLLRNRHLVNEGVFRMLGV